ncbi:NADH-quinone oxidoreductase subunit G [Gordonia sp. zg691]|uniref:NADH-quinone oxidoreductase subunit G n=1 Tax=Gordonia jinghuaiqii TaxID=2758710 RepID=UPI0016624381|nr:NADH-quinone oxidoreductase subunit G [Gordonia jinghuaiqii]MBD0863175.1 NADH-quinone oxidoreductase subunit G [Gordonia jinghuaiqii]
MTLTHGSDPATEGDNLVGITIDGREIRVPKGTLLIRAAEEIGITIPRFCDHPLLDPVGACRQCLVEVEGQRKPLASCTTVATDGMVVATQLSSEIAADAQRGVMELLLINHPLDCPVCDKGGECPLQNQAMSTGRSESRFDGIKRTFTKPVPLSSEVLLDRERCVLCARCTRFSTQIAGDPLIELADRGALQQVSIYADEPFDSYFSGNTVQICPVGALTGAQYRFRARPFDLVSTPSVCEHCASGCAQRTDHRRGTVLRRLAGDDPEVNSEWNCDKGRWAFTYTTAADRIASPLVRDRHGELHAVSWAHALRAAADGLAAANGGVGVLTGGRLTVEDAYAYSRFARTVLHTNDIDFRARSHSAEEADFLAARVAGRGLETTYDDLSAAPAVLLVGFEPEEESPIVFLRLRRAVRSGGQRVATIAPYASRGAQKLDARLFPAIPGSEAEVLASEQVAAHLDAPGAVLVVGERLATSPGALVAAVELADRTGARLAWIPRRAGERGALEVGALPNLLPGGRPVADATARAAVAEVWGAEIGSGPGRDTAAIIDAARYHGLALVVAGVDLDDLPDPAAAGEALAGAPFVVSLEQRHSTVTSHADVVFPVAAAAEKEGTFVDWEGRPRSFTTALTDSGHLPDHRVLDALARQMGVELRCDAAQTISIDLRRIGAWSGDRPAVGPHTLPRRAPAAGQAVLATWHMLLDDGRLQDGEPHLAGTARRPVARLSLATAVEAGIAPENGGSAAGTVDRLRVSTADGEIRLPVEIVDMPDRVVWVPLYSPGSHVHSALRAQAGDLVALSPAPADSGGDQR